MLEKLRTLSSILNDDVKLNNREKSILNLFKKGTTSISIEEIKKRLQIDAYKASRSLKSLEGYYEGALIERKVYGNDRRHRTISITSYGKEFLNRENEKEEQKIRALLNRLNKDEVQIFEILLTKVID